MTALLQLPTWLGTALVMLGTVALGVIPYLIVRQYLASSLSTESSGVVETVGIRVGAVHALILALVFAEAQATHAELREEVSKEITSVEHVASNLDRWDRNDVEGLRRYLAGYVEAILEKEWALQVGFRGSPEAKRAFDTIDLALLDLHADTPRRQTLRADMIRDMNVLQDHRKTRLSLTQRSLPPLFWWVAAVGFFITVSLFFVFPATPLHLSMLAMYGAYTGLVLYFTLALSHPFIGPAAIDTSGYSLVLDDLRGS